MPATRANIERALATIQNYGGAGSTELIPALRRAYAEPKPEQASRSIVVITDEQSHGRAISFQRVGERPDLPAYSHHLDPWLCGDDHFLFHRCGCDPHVPLLVGAAALLLYVYPGQPESDKPMDEGNRQEKTVLSIPAV